MIAGWLVVGVLAGGLAGWLLRARGWGPADRAALRISTEPEFLLDLFRRAHGADLACLVWAEQDMVAGPAGNPGSSSELRERAVAAARVARADGRQHVLGEGASIAAVGDGEVGLAVGWAAPVPPERAEAAGQDGRTLLAAMRAGWAAMGSRPSDLVPPSVGESLESIAMAVCEAAQRISEWPAAVVVRDPALQVASIVAVSPGADARLLRARVASDSAAGRACLSDVPIVGMSGKELFGQLRADRRRRSEQGIAFPLRDGRQGVGALVILAPPDELSLQVRQRLLELGDEAGPRLAAAALLRAAQARAETDELTGLPNRRALERALHASPSREGALLLLDLDHFKELNDQFGHPAGDAMLRHVARLLRTTLREDDLAARVGGEEFAVWLPETSLERAQEIAERVRQAVGQSQLYWAGADLKISCSIGVAGMPATVGQAANLYAAADAALYRAKEAGRNRVEVARPSR